jgi:HD-like signal output (HDOD) protein
MNMLSSQVNIPRQSDSAPLSDLQKIRRARLKAIVDNGLPPFPNTVLELTALLGGASVDIKKAGRVIRTDPSLSAQVLRMCNSPLFGLRSRVISIEQATVLIGTDRLRSLATACSLVNYSGHGLPPNQVMNFWQHSFLAGLLSEFLAKQSDYCEKEQAYIAGLLHDIGQIPQWMLAAEEKSKQKTPLSEDWIDNILVERDHFGMDHCEIGSCMAVTWNFMPSFIDVLGYHHDPMEAQHDPNLVQIIATIEHFLLMKDKQVAAVDGEIPHSADDQPEHTFSTSSVDRRGLPALVNADPRVVEMTLDKEYERLLPLVRVGLTSAIGGFG